MEEIDITVDNFPPALFLEIQTREKAQIKNNQLTEKGRYSFSGIKDARILSSMINTASGAETSPAYFYAAATIYTVFDIICYLYSDKFSSDCFDSAAVAVIENSGKELLDQSCSRFLERYPQIGTKEPREIWTSRDEIKEQLFLSLFNENPALSKYREYFTDQPLRRDVTYIKLLDQLENFFNSMPVFPNENLTLIEMLRAPMLASPDDLMGQLKYIKEHWGKYLGDYLLTILGSMDYIKEETKARFSGPGEPQGIDFGLINGDDRARFSPDSEWMPKVVMLAKSTLVWLDQLSKKYRREIVRLDQIPGEELDILAERGFNGLWLIGLWQRSGASKQIKQICGNPEAEASAYSLYNYEIAGELGGWQALSHLRHECQSRGIRLASDMVPNHTGIDSDWVRYKPDMFLSLPYCPFPQYRFNGTDLCGDPHIGVFLEDHYYEKSDAAVVFKRVDYSSGEERFIYHGNDGTSMPWNDTAQINFLNPQAREEVIQQILHVARNFPIIRFDAAMTLAKKHIQRLWFPAPGQGGDIPTRSEHSLSTADFEKAIPEEFWREVVDRIAQEVPDTLLLAEAFWMMEGYFVRNLGMHRVYNSAFMNMTKMERNKEFRELIKKTLELNPEILKRYVNFMNNPDEETAEAQFGKGDKYFGVATLMATLPGLPMFGHGQVEGFTEKYGMEYRRAYKDEQPDEYLVERHRRQIFPLLKMREIFSHAGNFQLYDLWNADHHINENVYAYSNTFTDRKSLVVFNNSYDPVSGWIKQSVPAMRGDEENGQLYTVSLSHALELQGGENRFCLLREFVSGKWFIRQSDEIIHSGMFFQLDGYQTQVFLDIHEVEDDPRQLYARLFFQVQGEGFYDLNTRLREILLQPLHKKLSSHLNPLLIKPLYMILTGKEKYPADKKERKDLLTRLELMKKGYEVLLDVDWPEKTPFPLEVVTKALSRYSEKELPEFWEENSTFYAVMALLDPFIQIKGEEILSEWMLPEWIARQISKENKDSVLKDIQSSLDIFSRYKGWYLPLKNPYELFMSLYVHDGFREDIGINEFEEVMWFNKEKFENVIQQAAIVAVYGKLLRKLTLSKAITKMEKIQKIFLKTAEKSGYKIESFLTLLKKQN